MQDFKELKIWKYAFELNKQIYQLTSRFPREEIYGLTSQLRRASVSISSNIAEGCGKRTSKDFINFLYNAMGSYKEVENQLLIALELNYLDSKITKNILEKFNVFGKMLTNFIKYISTQNAK